MSEDGGRAKSGGEGKGEREEKTATCVDKGQETQHIEQSQSSFSPHVDELDRKFEHFGNVALIEMSGIAARSRSPPRM